MFGLLPSVRADDPAVAGATGALTLEPMRTWDLLVWAGIFPAGRERRDTMGRMLPAATKDPYDRRMSDSFLRDSFTDDASAQPATAAGALTARMVVEKERAPAVTASARHPEPAMPWADIATFPAAAPAASVRAASLDFDATAVGFTPGSAATAPGGAGAWTAAGDAPLVALASSHPNAALGAGVWSAGVASGYPGYTASVATASPASARGNTSAAAPSAVQPNVVQLSPLIYVSNYNPKTCSPSPARGRLIPAATARPPASRNRTAWR